MVLFLLILILNYDLAFSLLKRHPNFYLSPGIYIVRRGHSVAKEIGR